MTEFHDYRAALDIKLPKVSADVPAAFDPFWAAVAKVRSMTDSETCRFGTLARLAKILLVLPHSNADPERLLSVVRKIETDQ